MDSADIGRGLAGAGRGDAEIKLNAVEDRLGLNPETRLRLGILAVEHKTKLDAFLEGK